MLKRLIIVILSIVALSLPLFASLDFTASDKAFFSDKFQENKTMLEEMLQNAKTAEDKAEVLWRLSRVYVSLGDDLDDNEKQEKFKIYEQGELYADQSIEQNPNPMAYLWKCSNIGRWGQTKGVLDSLQKTKPMLKNLTIMIEDFACYDSSEAWYVMGSMYNQLPGWPISFGDSKKAISYMRLATEYIPSNVIYGNTYKELAIQLWDRDWSRGKRKSEFAKIKKNWDKEKNNSIDQFGYYEGYEGENYKPFWSTVTLGSMSDKQEALLLLKYSMAVYNSRTFHTPSDDEDYIEIQELYRDWT